ncbi:MAG TPA: APC family permease [Vicinamibacteria bacterium]|jgi:APA family basic amino acid/polyamine antiporter|nr:APC family permease [Vicinamibacteria bacterium]
MPPPVAPRPTLVRAIGRWDLTAAVVNAVIGSSIFGMPAALAAAAGALSPLLIVLVGLGVLAVVLCFAEVASRFPDPGGPYLYAREAFGPFVGFEAGWLTFWIRVTALAASLNVFVEYLATLLAPASSPLGRALVMAAVVSMITAINVIGVRQAAWTVDVFTVAKLAPLALLVAIGLPHIRPEVLATQTVPEPDWTRAILLLVFAYGGFEAPLIPAAEARDPRRDSAFALLVALAIIASVYLLVQLVILGVLPRVALARAPLAATYAVLLGPLGVTLAASAAMVSISGYATGTTLQSPRVLFSMAERGELPGILARVHARFHTPHVAILVYSALVLGLALSGTFETIATASAFVRLVTYGLTCAALPVLRRRRPEEEPGFRLAGAVPIAVLGSLSCAWLLTRSVTQARTLLVLLVLGAALWVVAGRGRRPSGEAPPLV